MLSYLKLLYILTNSLLRKKKTCTNIQIYLPEEEFLAPLTDQAISLQLYLVCTAIYLYNFTKSQIKNRISFSCRFHAINNIYFMSFLLSKNQKKKKNTVLRVLRSIIFCLALAAERNGAYK